jgi:Calcineurin-like phosphoesterase
VPYDPVRGPASLLALAASYTIGRPAAAVGGAMEAIAVGLRVRRAPILRPHPALLAPADERVPVCSLVSDTHVTARGRVPSEVGFDPAMWPFRDPPDTETITAGLRRLLEHVHQGGPRTVIWCGDEVDTGEAAEWAHWRAVVAGVPGLAHRMVPGNHDICFNQPFDEDHSLTRRARREAAYQDHGPRLADYPVVDTIAGDCGAVTVLLLDSCKYSSVHVLSNAIGQFGEVQLDEVERILRGVTGPVLLIAHHHMWRDALFLQPDEWFNTALDADQLAGILFAYQRRAPRNRVLVCHGHRHTRTAGRITDGTTSIDIVGLPSSTLGDKADTGAHDAELRYAIAGLRADGTWGVALVGAGTLVAPARVAGTAPASVGRSLRALSPDLVP